MMGVRYVVWIPSVVCGAGMCRENRFYKSLYISNDNIVRVRGILDLCATSKELVNTSLCYQASGDLLAITGLSKT